jgi:hypothetical protein
VCRSIAGARSPSQPIRKYTNDGCSARVQNETSTSPFVGAASRCWLRAWRPGCVASAASSRDILMSPRRWTTCSSAGRHSRASSMNEPFDFLFAQAVEPIKELGRILGGLGSQRPDCVAQIPRSRRIVATRDPSRLSCGVAETQLGPSARISAAFLARALGHRGASLRGQELATIFCRSEG